MKNLIAALFSLSLLDYGYGLRSSIHLSKRLAILRNLTPTDHDLYTERDPERVRVLDTTLRDGEQAPGCTMNVEEKLIIAHQLHKLRVDVIEAGFPIASGGDFEAVSLIAKTVGCAEDPPIIAAMARAAKRDIQVCFDAIKHALFPRIIVVLPTSDIHMEFKLNKTRKEVVKLAIESIKFAKTLCKDVEFTAEDALRSDPEFLIEVFNAVVKEGATVINIPDTVGYATPTEFKNLVQKVKKSVKGLKGVIVSVHGHNDLGLAVANLLAGVEGGAKQIECTINGIGERAGNAALEECVTMLTVRNNHYNKCLDKCLDSNVPWTNVRLDEIDKTSKLLTKVTGMKVQKNKAIVGGNAFINKKGFCKDESLAFSKDLIGFISRSNEENSRFSNLPKFRTFVLKLGYDLLDFEIQELFNEYQELLRREKDITDEEIEFLVMNKIQSNKNIRYKINNIKVKTDDKKKSLSTITITDNKLKTQKTVSSTDLGPIQATYKAITELTKFDNRDIEISEYKMSSLTEGIDGLIEITVKVIDKTDGFNVCSVGKYKGSDMIVVFANAYIIAINRQVQLQQLSTPIFNVFNGTESLFSSNFSSPYVLL